MSRKHRHRQVGQVVSNEAISPHMSRRSFLTSTCAAVAATSMASTVWDLRLINAAYAQSASAAAASDYKALVCLFLFGGNDANNLIVPTDSDNYNAYFSARKSPTQGGIGLPNQGQTGGVLPLQYDGGGGRTYGIHPSCTGLRDLFNAGNLAVLTNVGTLVAPMSRDQYINKTVERPPQLFSHSDQVVQWQTSIPDQQPKTGWGGRCADLLYTLNNAGSIAMSISLAGQNTFEVNNVSSQNQYHVASTGTQGLSGISAAQQQAFNDLVNLGRTGTNLFERSHSEITRRAIDNNAILGSALATAPNSTAIPANPPSLLSQLAMVARMIKAATALGHKRQIFFVATGGFDLHNSLILPLDPLNVVPEDAARGPHADLLTDVSLSMKWFYDEIAAQGAAPNVTTFTASDFSRTLAVNGSIGSDHGWGTHTLIMGGAVKGKQLYGSFPSLTIDGPNDTGLGRWIPTTSVDEYSATLAKWFGVSATDLNTVFPNLSRFATPDLGFLL